MVVATVTFQPARSFPFPPSRARVVTIAMRIFHCRRASSIPGSGRRTVRSATLGPVCVSWRLQLVLNARLLRWVVDLSVPYANWISSRGLRAASGWLAIVARRRCRFILRD